MIPLRGKFGALVAFLGIAALVVGGLGWVTGEALQMEQERRLAAHAREREQLQKEQDERAQERIQQIAADRGVRIRQALMLLDSRLTPALAREDSRPYPHYEALHCPFPAVTPEGTACEPGQFLIPSPLMTAELPPWMLLHFQVDPVKGWTSPQVVPEALQKTLRKQPIELALNNVDDVHRKRLEELKAAYPARAFFATLQQNKIDLVTVMNDMQQQLQDLNLNTGNSFNPNFYGPYQFPLANTANTANGAQPQQPQSSAPNSYQNSSQNLSQYPAINERQDPSDSGRQRYGIISRGKNEGLWAYVNDGRNYSSLQGVFPYKTFDLKQGEVRGLEKQLEAAREEAKKKELRSKIDALKKESDELRKAAQPVEIVLTSLQPLWLPSPEQPKHLLMVRPARVGAMPAFQGILLDWGRLQEILKSEIAYLFPEARFVPLAKNDPDRLDREMFALPVEFDAGPLPQPETVEPVQAAPLPPAGWTPLRIGLAIAWAAALVALFAVGLGGWSLLDLSERRIRFVSAVTHELRTPLTTLRLYLDMLNSGLVSEQTQREEYLKTLSGEADRLHRLIGNVLDFARLEKARPNVDKRPVPVAGLLDDLRQTWLDCCTAAGKDLQIANALPPETTISTDRNLVEQILGNLIDNARKYSQDAADPHIWLRVVREGAHIIIEVEDRGPGVAKRERGSIFRPFRRGRGADFKAGGVGLGLALATRWAAFIGGRLSVQPGEGGIGARFRLELPG